MKIFKFGSCRSNFTNYSSNDFIYNTYLTHTLKEVIQYLNIYKENINMNDIKYIDCILPKDITMNINYMRTALEKCDIVLIEVSSLKLVLYENYYYNIVLSGQIKEFWTSKHKQIICQDESTFENDIKTIYNLLNKKTIIFLGHYNINNSQIKAREDIDNYLMKYTLHKIIISHIMEEKSLDYKDIIEDDLSHYKGSSAYEIISTYLHKYIDDNIITH